MIATHQSKLNLSEQSITAGNLTAITLPDNAQLDYTYDLAGNIETITLPSGRVATYTLNATGQPSTVAAPINGTATNLASSITYLPFGPLNALTYGNALTFSATYDHDYNPTNRTVSGSIYNNTYVTDANSNVTQAGTPTYGYDALNRVNAENPGTAASYTYDATDNRLTKVQGGTTTTTVPGTSNKISAVGANSYTYDAAGDITGDGTNTYTWSAAGNLATVNTTGGVYTYDWLHRRSEKVSGGNTTYYIYALDGTLIGEYNGSFAFIREYIYLSAGTSAQADAPLAQVNAGSPEFVTYLHADHLGTPRYATNAAGTSVWSWTADAFGVSTPAGTVTVNLGMPGQYYDSESGLFYNWNRYYNPAIGRYISSDPIGINGGLNTFGYVAQNPVTNIDPWGLVNLNLIPPTGTNLSLRQTLNDVNPPNVYSVATHGDPLNVTNANGSTLYLPQFIQTLYSNGYTQGEAIQLFSCNVGTGSDSFAQRLANKLGVPVTAPNDYIIVQLVTDGNGNVTGYTTTFVDSPTSFTPDPNGKWVTFYPQTTH